MSVNEGRVEHIPPLADREVRVYLLATGDRDTVRAASRRILATLLDTTVDTLAFDYTPQGKPLLRNDPSLHFSTSHSKEASLIGVTRVAPIGVDIEKIRNVPNAERILRRFFQPEEVEAVFANPNTVDSQFMQAWTRAEAIVKARGASVWEMATLAASDVVVRNIDVFDGYAGAVAVAHHNWVVTRFDYKNDSPSISPTRVPNA
jgi:phosphopantetheine--protein transferase-like protein